MNKVQEYLAEIRQSYGLKNAILYGITLSKRDKIAEFSLVTDKAYTEQESHLAEIITQKYIPETFTAKVKIIKRTPDKETVKGKIYDYVQSILWSEQMQKTSLMRINALYNTPLQLLIFANRQHQSPHIWFSDVELRNLIAQTREQIYVFRCFVHITL